MALPSLLFAAEDSDTRLRLDQGLLQQNIEKQKPLIEQQKQDQLPTMVIDGEMIKVENNLNDLGRALYIAVMQKQWSAASIYLQRYEKLEGYDVSLLKFAQGALARVQGHQDEAEQYFKDALLLQPNNAMIKLELARLLTERQKNQQAKYLFLEVKQELQHSDDPLIQSITKTIDVYLKGLNKRDEWQGSLSLGTRYATNINSASDHKAVTSHYVIDQDGNKILVKQETRGTPDPIDAQAFDYEVALNKRWSLQDNHGIAFKAFGYGRAYDDHKNFNEMTLNLNAGYSYQDQRNQILIAPVFEHRRYQNKSLSNAWGGRVEWMRFVGKDKAFKLEAEFKDIDNVLYSNQSGVESSGFATFWKVLPKQWTLFGGIDFIDHNSEEVYFTAYQQQGIRLGLSKQFSQDFNATLFSSFRWRQYDKFNKFLEAKRDDFEQNHMLIVSAPKWEFYGMIPSLMYQYNRNKSNVDWFYSYDKHNASFKLEYRF
ncbi:porin family protein [Acinetobacter rudis]|uniref:porin family protein n=1 Tax=Acinetobacter rudis TaxID=632955 RepID=UPI0033419843